MIRIVKMTFEASKVEPFRELFDRNKERIRGFDGCKFLELYQDRDNKNVFFTYSYWKDGVALEKYRHSALFEEVWRDTKKMFSARPEAWSVDRLWTGK